MVNRAGKAGKIGLNPDAENPNDEQSKLVKGVVNTVAAGSVV